MQMHFDGVKKKEEGDKKRSNDERKECDRGIEIEGFNCLGYYEKGRQNENRK